MPPFRILSAVLLFALAVPVFAGEINLPAPKKTGGTPLFEAIDQRHSAQQTGFPSGAIDKESLSTILWAASGLNRDGGRWTVPMAMGKEPYCKIYYVDAGGAYRYDWRKHALVQVSGDDLRAPIAMQHFAKEAPALLVLVADGAELAKLNNNPFTDEFAAVLVGAMSQNIYLACDAVGVGARLVYSINRDDAARLLDFGQGDRALCAIPVGKR